MIEEDYENMLEKDFNKNLVDVIKESGVYYQNNIGNQMVAGFPDIIMCIKGIFVSCELKCKDANLKRFDYQEDKISWIKDKMTDLQYNNYNKIAECSGVSCASLYDKRDGFIYLVKEFFKEDYNLVTEFFTFNLTYKKSVDRYISIFKTLADVEKRTQFY